MRHGPARTSGAELLCGRQDWNKAMAHLAPLEDKLVVLIGGGGFLGTHLAEELLRRGARLRIAERHPENAFRLKPLAELGQIQFARCDVTNRRSLEAVLHRADAAVYLVGTWGSDQHALQAEGAGRAAEIAAGQGAQAFAYVSALGAEAGSDSGYAATKAEGESLVRAAFPRATIVRPSILFGEDDKFVNLFAGLIAALPALPVFGAQAKLQPLSVDDAATSIANALSDPGKHGGKTYELTGPEVVTMEDLQRRIAAAQGRERAFIAVPDALAGLFAALPGTPMTSDQWKLLKQGNVGSGALPGCAALGVQPRPLGLVLDRWMTRYRKHGRFGGKREAV
jgi:NADH dehydrogenase